MYEVFYNDNCLTFAGEHEEIFLNTGSRIIRAESSDIIPEIIHEFLSGDPCHLVLAGDAENLWEVFSGHFQAIPAAGGVVQSESGFLFIFRRGRWDLPKGKIDPGETAAEAALREVTEETGLRNPEIVRYLGTTWHVYKPASNPASSIPVLKDTHWFLMRASASEQLVPETAEDIDEARWFMPYDLPLVLPETYSSLKGIITKLSEGKEGL